MKKFKYLMIIVPIIIIIIAVCLLVPDKTLELNGEKEITIQLNEKYQDEGTNIENCDIKGSVNTQKEGKYTITYTYKKQKVERVINVVDPSRIVINLNGDENTIVKQNDEYIESGCHVIDKKDGNITNQVKVSGKVDTSQPGDYKVTYCITNSSGLSVKKVRNVKVVENKKFEENKKGIPVLMYHYVYTKDDLPEKMDVNYILNTKLEEQLKYLTDHHYYFPSYQELEAYVKGKISLPKKSVILTFDDGQKGFLKYGIPLLEKYKVPATSFIIASKNGEKKVKQYASEYISFQSHSYNMHRGGGNIGHGGIISAMNKNQIVEDLKHSHEIVQNNEAFAYPYGDVTDIAQKAVKEANILCSFTTHYGKVKKGDDLTALPRVRVLGNNSLKGYISSIE